MKQPSVLTKTRLKPSRQHPARVLRCDLNNPIVDTSALNPHGDLFWDPAYENNPEDLAPCFNPYDDGDDPAFDNNPAERWSIDVLPNGDLA